MLFFPLLNAKLYKIFYWDKYFLIKVQKLTVVRFTLRGVKTAYNKSLCSAKRLEHCLAGLEKLHFQNSCVELIYIIIRCIWCQFFSADFADNRVRQESVFICVITIDKNRHPPLEEHGALPCCQASAFVL